MFYHHQVPRQPDLQKLSYYCTEIANNSLLLSQNSAVIILNISLFYVENNQGRSVDSSIKDRRKWSQEIVRKYYSKTFHLAKDTRYFYCPFVHTVIHI